MNNNEMMKARMKFEFSKKKEEKRKIDMMML
jgi:hypothetical protein